MILDIVFGVWFFLVVLIIAFIRGSSLKTPPSGRAPATRKLDEDARAEFDMWRRHGRDAG